MEVETNSGPAARARRVGHAHTARSHYRDCDILLTEATATATADADAGCGAAFLLERHMYSFESCNLVAELKIE